MTVPIVLTCGEPAGIGPEIAVKAWRALGDRLPFFWLGDPRHLPQDTPIATITDPAETSDASPHGLPVLLHDFPKPATPGQPDPANAPAVVSAIARGVKLVTTGTASAITTAPINKKVLIDGAGFAYPGHTEYLAALAGVDHVAMMLASDALRVVPVTIHVALSRVPGLLTAELVERTIRLTHDALIRDFKIAAPRIAVCGLNPHAGEGGAMGDEDLRVIAPVLGALRAEGMTLIGPLPADTMFHARARQGYDAAVAMYHDQALIPIKTLAFDEGVNLTLGLPFVRTSPDHGTAFDIAGKGIADPSSLIEALRLAQTLARARA